MANYRGQYGSYRGSSGGGASADSAGSAAATSAGTGNSNNAANSGGRDRGASGAGSAAAAAAASAAAAAKAAAVAKQASVNANMTSVDAAPSPEDGFLGYYLPKFYRMARGHVLNKYHVMFSGEYIDEALRVMDLNSYRDKYNESALKLFHGESMWHDIFKDWLTLNYDPENRVLNMYWAAANVKIPGCGAKIEEVRVDSTKDLSYPVISGHTSSNCELSITVMDDPYMMWWQFFNALFNVQYSPLVLKPRSTWQKMHAYVKLYTEGVTTGRSIKGGTEEEPVITDLVTGEMFEFNSIVLKQAPSLDASYDTSTPATFNISFRYPNAFQGSFKNTNRYLRNNTTDRPFLDSSVVDAGFKPVSSSTTFNETYNPSYHTYNTGALEDSYETLQKTAYSQEAIYEANRPNVYKSYQLASNWLKTK